MKFIQGLGVDPKSNNNTRTGIQIKFWDVQERSFIHPDLLKDILAEEENGGTRGKTDLTKKPKNKNKKNKKKKAAK